MNDIIITYRCEGKNQRSVASTLLISIYQTAPYLHLLGTPYTGFVTFGFGLYERLFIAGEYYYVSVVWIVLVLSVHYSSLVCITAHITASCDGHGNQIECNHSWQLCS